MALSLACVMTIVAPATQAQKAPDWQTAAGGKMAFEVASVRPKAAGTPYDYSTNVDLDGSDYFRYAGGVVKTNGLLANYILFAYKIADASEYPRLLAQLPKWAQTTEFQVEARPAGKPTKDQMRLMMQTLLADRFGLKVHAETQHLPIYALVLDKPGEPGPQLQPHPDDGLCNVVPGQIATAESSGSRSAPVPSCQPIVWPADNGMVHLRIDDWTMEQIAGELARDAPLMGGLDPRPIVDETGLKGSFDIDVKFLRPSRKPQPVGADGEAEAPGPTFVEALKNQAGLKLVKQTGPVDVLVVDHVEMPSEN